jgi:predicted regulator of Ras-like GTPase activity (Roadblock/LC7/MglB family)
LNTASTDPEGLSTEAKNLHWLLGNLVCEVRGIQSVAVVSSDGLLLASSDAAALVDPESADEDGGTDTDRTAAGDPPAPSDSAADLSTVVSGLASLTDGASRLMDTGRVKQTVVTMDNGHLFVMAISDGSLLGVHAAPECDLSVIAYEMAMFVGRAGHVLNRELRVELRRSLER